ncbi:FHA domain protein [Mycobacterium xenopi 3993]|nr:FHA domain protein [Mycobacterium xenopi 3993]
MLTVRYDGSQRTFAPGHDVVIGRDLRADMRITHPLISRAHLLLRYDQGRWLAIDNGSLNGTFVNGRRVPVVDIHDGQSINIGNPDGPRLTFEVGRHQGLAGRPPQTASMRAVQPSGAPPRLAPPRPADSPAARGRRNLRHCGHIPVHLRPRRRTSRCIRPAVGIAHPPIPAAARSRRLSGQFTATGPGTGPAAPKTQMSPAATKPPEVSNLATKMIQALRPAGLRRRSQLAR